MWDEIDLANWKEIPCITGRPATEEDIEGGIAVFAIPFGSKPYDIELPLCAIQIDKESNKRTPCIAIQIEEADNGVFVGVRYLNGGNGVGTTNEFELFFEPNEEFGL
ncbi:MAG: hypothetical protein GXP21_09020 [Gammaproteobacteria bacterium]|nr:hypothetical protein [Gammaproteobacteria bacterium]